MEGESDATGSIIDELHPTDIQGDQLEEESGVARSNTDEQFSSDIRGD